MEQDLIKLIAELIPGWTAADWGEIKEKVDSTGFVSEEGEPYSKTALQRIWKETPGGTPPPTRRSAMWRKDAKS